MYSNWHFKLCRPKLLNLLLFFNSSKGMRFVYITMAPVSVCLYAVSVFVCSVCVFVHYNGTRVCVFVCRLTGSSLGQRGWRVNTLLHIIISCASDYGRLNNSLTVAFGLRAVSGGWRQWQDLAQAWYGKECLPLPHSTSHPHSTDIDLVIGLNIPSATHCHLMMIKIYHQHMHIWKLCCGHKKNDATASIIIG